MHCRARLLAMPPLDTRSHSFAGEHAEREREREREREGRCAEAVIMDRDLGRGNLVVEMSEK